jgi:5-methylcytosine-specific restriction enzyme A
MSRLRVCPTPGCPELTEARSCAACSRATHRRINANRPNVQQLGYTEAWNRRSRAYRAAHPTCEWPGCDRPSAHTDHIVADVRPTGRERDDELQALCQPHHSQKTATSDVARDERGRWVSKERTAPAKQRARARTLPF